MKLAIADPPYLGRGDRWYGAGRGHQNGQGLADNHPDACRYDVSEAHQQLLALLQADYDGWAVALAPDSLSVYLAAAPVGARVAVWVKPNGIPSGSRIRATFEPVLLFIPPSRRAHQAGLRCDDTLTCPAPATGFTGAKPEKWTHWVLDLLGYTPNGDQVTDLFPGSGAVTQAVATYPTPQGRAVQGAADKMQRLRTARRAATNRRPAVLAALAAGGSIRSVARDAGISTNTVQRWKGEAAIRGSGKNG